MVHASGYSQIGLARKNPNFFMVSEATAERVVGLAHRLDLLVDLL
jgi:hypothetical protein